MQRVLVEVGLRRCTDCCQRQQQYNVSTHSVIFVDCFGIFHAAKDRRGHIELRKSEHCLQEDEYVCHEAHDAVNTGESTLWMVSFVDLDYCQACDQGEDTNEIEREVEVCSQSPLLRSMGGLED